MVFYWRSSLEEWKSYSRRLQNLAVLINEVIREVMIFIVIKGYLNNLCLQQILSNLIKVILSIHLYNTYLR